MKGVNKVILVGNLGKDPELKFTPQGSAVAKFPLATTRSFKGKDGQWQDQTDWHNVVVWEGLAKIAGDYLKKAAKSISKSACKRGHGMTRPQGRRNI